MSIFGIIQFFFAVVIGLYFWNLLRKQQKNKRAVVKESKKEMRKLKKMRQRSLTEPLSEKTRPDEFEEIIGQEDGLKALEAALCGPNPQHVIVYGPPGIGKTAAARLVLERAKKNEESPFDEESKFVELDATTARFDERGIADPLIGSVHDPIYQGAGAMGSAGIPQPKPGAVTKAHGGLLFIDEIGELHPIQMNKLLKVLEDRKVFLESSYYQEEDDNIPQYIHEIFQQGLPADFRMVGATTRKPEDIPPAIRSRCLEVYFKPLTPKDIEKIAQNAANKAGFAIEEGAIEVIKDYSNNGRDTVNMIQTAGGLVLSEDRKVKKITTADIEWVVNSGKYDPRPEKDVNDKPQVGVVNGLAVKGPNLGILIELEVSAIEVESGTGDINVTGIIEEEEVGNRQRKVRRKSMVKGSIENVMTTLRKFIDVNPKDYDLHVNFPGGIPLDGPSAGITVATAIYSVLTRQPVNNSIAMTGELSIRGLVKPIGGVLSKIEAAKRAGAKKVIIPAENWQENFANFEGIEIVKVNNLKEVLDNAVLNNEVEIDSQVEENVNFLTASSIS
ncbi:ATP-dependent protease LonB [Sporohalobacter salinus]|uniref:ATP-dependent protease LonB n=1 Tax=Sporohalobacter salinus TaxID=1494606 RepID=UPI0019605CC3|nr:ATP-dependent protease LonB [Sporohalobacter salinus]MBM7624841.1 Lon-like ATP-dependent protease [Sporohalobacter salinus]